MQESIEKYGLPSLPVIASEVCVTMGVNKHRQNRQLAAAASDETLANRAERDSQGHLAACTVSILYLNERRCLQVFFYDSASNFINTAR